MNDCACLFLQNEVHSFNRYMVECEYIGFTFEKITTKVLIDTWWNVNKTYLIVNKCTEIVLIDTWWNVNVYEFVVFKINLAGFNRYMVECEFAQTMGADYYPATVLIDTWWNVNYVSFQLYLPRIGFNRYMVECECVWSIGYGHTGKVLIDTWWNVNCCIIDSIQFKVSVLIDTWWNVNAKTD